MPARRSVANRPSRNCTGISRARARSPIGTGVASPRRASSERARSAYGDLLVITSTRRLYGMGMRSLRLGLWLPPLILMGVIFAFSAQPSLNSGLGLIDHIGRKVIHFGEYALLCFLWWRPLKTVTNPRRAVLLAFVLASAYAITDEFHQTFVEGRHGTPVDWLIDSAGAGLVAIQLWRTRARSAT